MTTRVKALTVALEEDIREDDVEQLVMAIKRLRGVLAVDTAAADPVDFVARERVRRELTGKLWDVLHPKT